MKRDVEALLAIVSEEEARIVDEWLKESRVPEHQRSAAQGEATQVLRELRDALAAGADPAMLEDPRWAGLNHVLEALSSSRAAQGRTAGDTSRFVLAFKRPVLALAQRRHAGDAALLMDTVWVISSLVDQMAQHTVTTYQLTRESVIRRQQEELLELSTPVIKLWDGVLAVPMIGTLDSSRTQMVMESLLEKIVETESALAIVDITGVPTVDTLVAQHLLKTVSAIRLMGADCIISGIRPQIAQTIVHLGIDLEGIMTKASLADALGLALERTGHRIVKAA
ncbi:STAS domain-containing protein [Ramlibacter sp.]|uniref:STAS domain-containing protein n=1 Tax=Ramlibacter sp. TaxID=1917967 RepID=UPI002D10A46B|nr:STAS domain-containing protein [Ramlibacter sp.]HWI82441.1 STAS domain-containing protein [Ramlibacter sp.]